MLPSLKFRPHLPIHVALLLTLSFLPACLFTSNGKTSFNQLTPVFPSAPAFTSSYSVLFTYSYLPGSITSLTIPSLAQRSNLSSLSAFIHPAPILQILNLDGTGPNTSEGPFWVTLTPYKDSACTIPAHSQSNGNNANDSFVERSKEGWVTFQNIQWPNQASPFPYYLQASGPQLISTCSGGLQFNPTNPVTPSHTANPTPLWTLSSNNEIPIPYSDGGSLTASQCRTNTLPTGLGSFNTSAEAPSGCYCVNHPSPSCFISYNTDPSQSASTSVYFPYTLLDGTSSTSGSVEARLYDWKNPLFSLVQQELSKTQLPVPNIPPISVLYFPLPTLPTALGGALYSSTILPKWAGGVLGTNGKIYAIPAMENRVLEISLPLLSTGSLTYYPISGSIPTAFSAHWFGGVLAADGNIYGIPHDNNINGDPAFLQIQTSLNSPPQISLGGGTLSILDQTQYGWTGGSFIPNLNEIYLAPFQSNKIIRLNVSQPALSSITIPSIMMGTTTHFSGAVYAPNGSLYFIPALSPYAAQLNPQEASPSLVQIGNAPLTTNGAGNQWSGGVLANNGKIYALPDCADSILVITPQSSTQAVDATYLINPGTFSFTPNLCNKYQGGSIGLDGRIYSFPAGSHPVIGSANTPPDPILVIDPRTDEVSFLSLPNALSSASRSTAMGTTPSKNRWVGAVTTPDGSVLGIPGTENGIVQITFPPLPSGSVWNPNVTLSPYFNKY